MLISFVQVQSTLQQLFFNLASVKVVAVCSSFFYVTTFHFSQTFVHCSAGLQAIESLFSNYLKRYFKFMARQTSAVAFQLNCSEQLAVLNCSLATQRNV